MSDLNVRAPQAHAPGDDQVLPFQLEGPNLRGRLARLDGVLNDILGKHDYPAPVAQKLAETVTLAVALASALKYDGVFTLQTKGDGAINMMVADVVSNGDVRGYAQYQPEALAAAKGEGVADLLGSGYLAFTVDQGEDTERYQGIVELTGDTLPECVQHYFRQSEQISTGIRMAASRDDGSWRAGAIMVQRLPGEGEAKALGNDVEDDWRRAMVLLGSARDSELLDPELSAERLLFRLFHEEGVRVYEPKDLRHNCRCSRGRVEDILRTLPRDEVATLKEDGVVKVTCEFCNASYGFDDEALARLYRQ